MVYDHGCPASVDKKLLNWWQAPFLQFDSPAQLTDMTPIGAMRKCNYFGVIAAQTV